MRARRGFTLIEILTVVTIIGVLATLTIVATAPALKKGRDTKRKNDLSQIRRVLAGSSCYMPDGGAGDYELGDIFTEVLAKNPQFAQAVSSPPRDPRGGTAEVTKYRYVVSADGTKCALYANLEYEKEHITLPAFSAPTPGGGTGVLQGATEGVNGTTIYFQATN